MSDQDRLKALDERIEAAKAENAPTQSAAAAKVTMAQQAWRMVIELVVGICLGAGMGYGLDYLLGTTPWLMIILLGFGFAAGIRTVMRSAAEIQKQNATLDELQTSEQD